jgi:hypothetical protein
VENVIHPWVDQGVDLRMDQIVKKTAIEVVLFPYHRWLLVERRNNIAAQDLRGGLQLQ